MTNAVAPAPTAELERFFASLTRWVVLRNEADLPGNLARGGDIDLLVEDPGGAESALRGHLGPPVRIVRRATVTTYSFAWGHIDLMDSVGWRGADYVSAAAILDNHRVSARGWPVPRPAHEAIVSWFSSLLWGGFFKERYASVIAQAAATDGEALRKTLIEAAGRRWGTRLWDAARAGRPGDSARWVGPVRRAVWLRALRRQPAATLAAGAGHYRREIALRLAPPVPWVALLGSDGSGKSSLVDALTRRAGPHTEFRSFHLRPRLLARRQDGGPVTDPHGKPSRGPIGSYAALALLVADWTVGYWGRLVHLRAKGYVLLFDRIYYDTAIDPRRYRYGGRPGVVRRAWALLPRPDLVFFLDVDPMILRQRKPEVPVEELTRQRAAYAALVTSLPGGRVLDGSQPLDVTADSVLRVIEEWLRVRARGGDAGRVA